jgi:hypothetical protein
VQKPLDDVLGEVADERPRASGGEDDHPGTMAAGGRRGWVAERGRGRLELGIEAVGAKLGDELAQMHAVLVVVGFQRPPSLVGAGNELDDVQHDGARRVPRRDRPGRRQRSLQLAPLSTRPEVPSWRCIPPTIVSRDPPGHRFETPSSAGARSGSRPAVPARVRRAKTPAGTRRLMGFSQLPLLWRVFAINATLLVIATLVLA